MSICSSTLTINNIDEDDNLQCLNIACDLKTMAKIVPPQIQPREQGGKMVVGVADVLDDNERTVDGKRTTHAMSSILVTPSTSPPSHHKLLYYYY